MIFEKIYNICRRLGFFRAIGGLDAASLTALAGRHLGLDDDGAEVPGGLCRPVGGPGEAAFGHGNPRRRQQRLGGVFLEIHFP